jgi:hypothetical protein
MIARSLRFLTLSFALLPAACGSEATTTAVQPLTCQTGQFRLQGTLGGEPVDVSQSSAGGGLTQVDTGELQIGDGPESSVPRTRMDLVWAHGLPDGASSAASGTVTPGTGSFAGQTLCVGTGTKVTIYTGDNGVGFVLDGLASGANCETPIEGTLTGCWN